MGSGQVQHTHFSQTAVNSRVFAVVSFRVLQHGSIMPFICISGFLSCVSRKKRTIPHSNHNNIPFDLAISLFAHPDEDIACWWLLSIPECANGVSAVSNLSIVVGGQTTGKLALILKTEEIDWSPVLNASWPVGEKK